MSLNIAINVPVENGLNQPRGKQRNIRVGIIVPVTIAGLIVLSCLVLYIYYKRRKVQDKKGNKFEPCFLESLMGSDVVRSHVGWREE